MKLTHGRRKQLADGQTARGCRAGTQTGEWGSRAYGLNSRIRGLSGEEGRAGPNQDENQLRGPHSPLAGGTLSTACKGGGAGHPLPVLQASRAGELLGSED